MRLSHTVQLSLLAAGTVDDYPPARREELAAALAAQAGVPRAAVLAVDVLASSVIVNATLSAASASAATALASTLASAFAHADNASAALNIDVLAPVVIRTLSELALVPAPAPPPQRLSSSDSQQLGCARRRSLGASDVSVEDASHGRVLSHPKSCAPSLPGEVLTPEEQLQRDLTTISAVASVVVVVLTGLVLGACHLCRRRRSSRRHVVGDRAGMEAAPGTTLSPSQLSTACVYSSSSSPAGVPASSYPAGIYPTMIRRMPAEASAATATAVAVPSPLLPRRSAGDGPAGDSSANGTSVYLFVGGMSCEHCVALVRDALSSVSGVQSAEVSLEAAAAAVMLAPSVSRGPATLLAAVEATGKAASEAHVALSIMGMSCGHCVDAVTSALRSVAGVRKVAVSLEWGLAIVQLRPPSSHDRMPITDGLLAAVEGCGKFATLLTPASGGAGGHGGTSRPSKDRSSKEELMPAATSVDDGIASRSGPSTLVVKIFGMRCNGCMDQVEGALRGVQGITSVHVDLLDASATVVTQGVSSVRTRLVDAVHATGRTVEGIEEVAGAGADGDTPPSPHLPPSGSQGRGKVTPRTPRGVLPHYLSPSNSTPATARGDERDPKCLDLSIEGMSCAACSLAVEEALQGVHGVRSASVALMAHSAKVYADLTVCTVDPLLAAVQERGFRATPAGPTTHRPAHSNHGVTTRLHQAPARAHTLA